MQAFSGKPPREKPQNAAADLCQDHGKGGLSLRGVAFMTVLAVLESTLLRADFWEGDATEHFSVKKRDFQ